MASLAAPLPRSDARPRAVALWLLGIGWSFGLIGGSSLLVDAMPLRFRVRSQGVSDLAMSLCGGCAGFASGFVRDAIGYHLLAGTAGAFCVLMIALPGRDRARPGVGVAA
jgi:fucose permease